MFDFLPTVEDCCFCCSLKTGSILIAVCGLLGLCGLGSVYFSKICTEGNKGIVAKINKFFSYVALGVDVLMAIFCLIFLIAICTETCAISATLLLIFICIYVIMGLAKLILIVVSAIIDSNCREGTYFQIGVILIPLWIYFMIVLRSYKDEME